MGTISRSDFINFLQEEIDKIGRVFHIKIKKRLPDGTPIYALRYKINGKMREKYLGKQIPKDLEEKLKRRKKLKELLKLLRSKKAKERKLFLVGYQETDIHSFVKMLKEFSIGTLVDIRLNPWSRRKEFRKKELNEILRENGIVYIHIPSLGNPQKIRNEYKVHKDNIKMLMDYYIYISSLKLDVISMFYKSYSKPIVLMCYEKEATSCHRLALAIKLLLEGVIDEFSDIRQEIDKNQVLLFCENLSEY